MRQNERAYGRSALITLGAGCEAVEVGNIEVCDGGWGKEEFEEGLSRARRPIPGPTPKARAVAINNRETQHKRILRDLEGAQDR